MVALPNTHSPTIDAVDHAVVDANPQRRSRRIGGSIIGKPCERQGWYAFRWATAPEQFEGRMLRLFDTGHVEEDRMVAWLRMTGAVVQAVDPNTGAQFEFTNLDGHLVGKLDGIATGLVEAPATPHLLECKTHNAKSFAQLLKTGVAAARPEHVAQMQIYMHLSGLTRAFYLAKNKDNDALYGERVKYDANQAIALIAKAERIKDADAPPAKISEDIGSFQCRYCPAATLCHQPGPDLAFAERNCRTCLHSAPAPSGTWHCARHNRDLTTEDQEAGCPNHLYLPGLVPGEQLDADEREETVTYALDDGAEWADGAREGANA